MKKIIAGIAVVILLSGGAFLFWQPLTKLASNVGQRVFEYEKLATNLADVAVKYVALPPPLRAKIESPTAVLTQAGTIDWTNQQRTQFGLPALEPSDNLSAAAAIKAKDLFERQYFEHTAPDGTQASDLAAAQGYDYLAIGENLALGNFADDQALVLAWMDSPGHRENILNQQFTQIGVGVARGTYEKRETWVAVQIFGRPASDCPRPSPELRQTIEQNKAQLTAWEQELAVQRSELEKTSKDDRAAYNAKVEAYNSLVRRYNTLLEEAKIAIENFNTQVGFFNNCIKG